MLLLTGPPGSGKTHEILWKVRQGPARLLTPTATMAEHLSHELARRDGVAPAVVGTLWRFADEIAPEPGQAPDSLVRHLVARAVDPPFREMPGYRTAVARLLEEADSFGAVLGGQIGQLLERIRGQVSERGMVLRGGRLRAVARAIEAGALTGVNAVLFDGFFRFTPAELELIAALTKTVEVTVTLPDYPGAEPARQALLGLGFGEQKLSARRAEPVRSFFQAPTPDREASEIARRVLALAAAGRPFREIGVIVRSESPQVAPLRRAFARFGIPARYYFAQSLGDHPAAARVIELIDALLTVWDHESLYRALRLCRPTSALDRFQLDLLETIPGAGLETLPEHDEDSQIGRIVGSLRGIQGWRTGRATPAEWAKRLSGLPHSQFPAPRIGDGISHEQATVWRSYAAASEALGEAMEEAATLFAPEREISLDAFWAEARAVTAETELRVADRRRNVVHVMDAYEARQWELPVVFVCGLLERQFPKHHSENPLFGDLARERLRGQGIYLPTTDDAETEERFLFELATTRATSELVLSYAAFNENGQENLPSFLLERFREKHALQADPVHAVRPRPLHTPVTPPPPRISSPELLAEIASRHSVLSASSMGRFIECPFQFFAEKTLKLKERPPAPRDRLDFRSEGSIVHNVLAAYYRPVGEPPELDELFEEVFESYCTELGVPEGYRKETARILLRDDARRFVETSGLDARKDRSIEQDFRFSISSELSVRGRIDRIERYERGSLVIDYKYALANRLKHYVETNEDGRSIQAGLYLLATRKGFKERVAGMLFCTVKREVKWDGWHRLPEAGELAELASEDEIEQMIELAEATALEVAARIRSGEIAPSSDPDSECRFCEANGICRVDAAPLVRIAGGS